MNRQSSVSIVSNNYVIEIKMECNVTTWSSNIEASSTPLPAKPNVRQEAIPIHPTPKSRRDRNVLHMCRKLDFSEMEEDSEYIG